MVAPENSLVGRKLSHYLIERQLGEGGMGIVYLAHDVALARDVALKVLHADVASDLRPRLEREGHAFARLQHPWIATFYEISEDGGTPFLAMEYVRGETLRKRLGSGALPLSQALAVTGCLLEALAHAHAARVLHRDIKPENVMLVGNKGAKLLDFGLAKTPVGGTSAPGSLTETNLTTAGHVVGTLGYMAPEQLQGRPADARADLFAVGAVLFETIAGTPAFPGATATERMAAILSDAPRLRGPSVTAALESLVARALTRDPADRFPTATAFLSELRKLEEGAGGSTLPDSIGVLDLENLSKSSADDWMANGIAESVTADLARVPGLHVVARERALRARAAVMAQGETAADPVAVGHRLGCRWILSGGVQRMGPALRITARLVEVPTARVVWAEKLDGTAEEIFQLQDRLAAAITARLNLAAPSTTGSSSGDAGNAQAFELYARGRRMTDRHEKGAFQHAQELFERAIELDPRYAPALCGLAEIYAMRFTFTTDPAVLDEAERYARRAIDADPTLGEPNVWLSYAMLRRGNTDAAFEAAHRAVELKPNFPYGHYFCACARSSAGRYDESAKHFQRTIETDPGHGFAWLGLGWSHLELGHMDEAIWSIGKCVELERVEGMSPTAGAGGLLAECYRRAGNLDAARRTAMEGLASADRSDHMYRDTFRAICLVSLGRTALQQNDRAAAAAAFQQAVLHMRGRPRALGGGQLLVQALAGQTRAGAGTAPLDEALELFTTRRGYDFSWFWVCKDNVTTLELARAARIAGRAELAREHLAEARKLGSLEAKAEEDV